MIRKILFLTALLLVIPSSVYAQGKNDLTTCDSTSYCQGNDLIQKSNCNFAPQFQDCNQHPNECHGIAACFCTYYTIGTCQNGQPLKVPGQDVIGTITPPTQVQALGFGAGGISNFIVNLISLIFVIAGIVFLFMIVLGAFSWITSSGDKEALAKARQRIVHAIIGLTLLALSLFLVRVIGNILGFDIIK